MPTLTKRTVPFCPNTITNDRCFQACIYMILNYFLPEKEFLLTEIETMTGFVPGKPTWAPQGLTALRSMGFDVIYIRDFDGQAFISDGLAYLRRFLREDIAPYLLKSTDIAKEQFAWQKLLVSGIRIEKRQATYEDIERFLDAGYLVICSVNGNRLAGEKGFSGHYVLVYKLNEQTVTYHNPGRPPHPAATTNKEEFLEAWHEHGALHAIKL